jgi:hypothetical protein
MKIEGDYIIIELGDDCTPLVKVQLGDAYGSVDRHGIHWTEYDKYSEGAAFHGKAMYLFRRPLSLCKPNLLELVDQNHGLRQHFI